MLEIGNEKEIRKLAKKMKEIEFCNARKRPIACSGCELAPSPADCGELFEIGFIYGYLVATDKIKIYNSKGKIIKP